MISVIKQYIMILLLNCIIIIEYSLEDSKNKAQ